MKKHIFAFVWLLCLLQINTSSIFAAPVINEFSSADSSDWIEIYNSGTEVVDLSLYRIRDLSVNNKLDLSGSLNPSSFVSFDWSNKLNNGGDLIKLVFTTDESTVDQVSYGDQGGLTSPSSNQAGGRQTDGSSNWVIFNSPTKSSSNNSSSVFSPPTATPTKTPTPTKIPTPTKSPTPTKIPTVAKASSGDAKTPTPKISSIANPSAYSTKIANSAKISTYSKPASQFATVKSLGEDKEKEDDVKVLGTKDSKFPFVPILIGIVLLTVAGGWFVFKNLEQIKIWIKK